MKIYVMLRDGSVEGATSSYDIAKMWKSRGERFDIVSVVVDRLSFDQAYED